MTLRDGFKLEVPHSKDCFFGEKPADFILYDGRVWNLRRNGARGGSTLWHRFSCNSPICPARLLVRWDILNDLLREGQSG